MNRGSYWSGTVSNLIGVFLLSLIAIISTPLLINLMGDEVFAIFRVSIVSVVSFVFLLDVGMSGSVKRYMGHAINTENINKQHQFIGLALIVYGVISLVALLAVFALSYWLPLYLSTPDELVFDFKVLLWAVAVYISLQLLQSVASNVFVVYGRFDIIQSISVSSRFFHMFGIAAAIAIFNYPLISSAIVTLIVSITTLLTTVQILRKLWTGWGISFKGLSKDEIKGFFSLSIYGLLIALGPVVIYYGQDLIVVKAFGLDQLVYYIPALVISMQLRVILNSFASPVFSIASRLHVKKDYKGLAVLVRENIERSFCVWLVIGCPIIVMGESLLSVWMGERFAFASDILSVFIIGLLGLVLYLPPFHILNACGKLRVVALSSLFMVLVFLLFCWITIDLMELGLVSVAVAMAISLFLRGLIVFSMVLFEFKFYSLRNAFAFLLKGFFSCALCFIGSYMIRDIMDMSEIVGFLIGSSISFIYSIAVVFLLVLPRNDRYSIMSNLFKNRKGKGEV